LTRRLTGFGRRLTAGLTDYGGNKPLLDSMIADVDTDVA
jgi:hypothetical protein